MILFLITQELEYLGSELNVLHRNYIVWNCRLTDFIKREYISIDTMKPEAIIIEQVALENSKDLIEFQNSFPEIKIILIVRDKSELLDLQGIEIVDQNENILESLRKILKISEKPKIDVQKQEIQIGFLSQDRKTAVLAAINFVKTLSEAEKNSRSLMQRFGALEVAMRQCDLAWEVRDYLKTHPCAAVVNLGCGLDNTGRACDNGSCNIYNLDFPDVITVRNELLPAGEREENIPCNLNDTEWLSQIDASGGAVFFASGVFYYFLMEQVKALVQKMADAFPSGMLVFDAANRTAVKMIAKTWLKSAKIKDVGAYFAVSDAKSELSLWDSRLQVTSRGYMLGYNDLRDPSVSGFFRLLAKVGDGMMKMQIVKIGFGGKQ